MFKFENNSLIELKMKMVLNKTEKVYFQLKD